MLTAVEQESLDANTWFDRMRRLVEGLGEGDGTPDRHIRKAYHLHALAPQPIKEMMPAPVEEERLEAMLECGAYESAVASLIGNMGQVTVGCDDRPAGIEVRLRVEPGSPSGEDTIASWPRAMLEAWAVSFLRLRPLPN